MDYNGVVVNSSDIQSSEPGLFPGEVIIICFLILI